MRVASILRVLAVAAPALALAAPILAEAPQSALRPSARPIAEAPLRPAGRPVAEDSVTDIAVAVEADTPPRDLAVAVVADTTDSDISATDTPAPEVAVAVAVDPPALSAVPATVLSTSGVLSPPTPRGVLRAEEMMASPAVLLLAVWNSKAAPTRPAYMARAAVQPLVRAPARPSLRPHMPWMDVVQDPNSLPVEEGDAGEPGFTELAVAFAFRPPERPPHVARQAEQVRAERARGMLCGQAGLEGDVLGHVSGPGACGVEDAVRVRAIAGIRLSTPATMTCDTARALLRWTRDSAIPAVGNQGGGLVSMRTGGGYTCRNRNNQAGGRLSEHAFGRALDIMGFGLRDGSEISVLRGWNSGHGDRLRNMWRAACGPFGTVLGPNANAAHRDHFHFDTAAYRSGSYCR